MMQNATVKWAGFSVLYPLFRRIWVQKLVKTWSVGKPIGRTCSLEKRKRTLNCSKVKNFHARFGVSAKIGGRIPCKK